MTVYMTNFYLRIVSTAFSVQSWFCSLLLLFTWESVHLVGCLLGICPYATIPTWHCFLYWFSQLWIVLTCGSVYLGVHPSGTLSTLIQSSQKTNYMTNFYLRIVSTAGSVQSGFCSLMLLSTWESLHLGVCLLEICTLRSLAKWHSPHVGLCPVLVVSILDSVHVWVSPFGCLYN